MDDNQIISGLQQRNESVFSHLVDLYHVSMVRIARIYVSDDAIAEEIAQETWLRVLEGIDQFERRSTLKTWIFSILNNLAKTRWRREGKSIPFSELDREEVDADEVSVPAERFFPADHPLWPNGWSAPPRPWNYPSEEYLISQELRLCIQEALECLPDSQRIVMELHDIQGWSSPEICNAFCISETNLRVLLHRARAKIRRAIEANDQRTHR